MAGGLIAIGIAPDGLIEALELPGHKFGLAAQWHPESLNDQSALQKLFSAFTNAASGIIRI